MRGLGGGKGYRYGCREREKKRNVLFCLFFLAVILFSYSKVQRLSNMIFSPKGKITKIKIQDKEGIIEGSMHLGR